ncbi:glycosyltransferase family 2 protein [Elizabethkingia anophelis]|uniref:glycosyltransferase family 2 protein n=1 Tax=Elizabethkingia anophelis TaxID=1117645 RepID=UPI00372E7D68
MSINMVPHISIIVPCYNQAQYLDECLNSVLVQTYKNWECIIVNDGSPDNTGEIALQWTEKDSRFKYIKKDNGGLSSARNAGINKAVGKWILPLDADDKISNDYLSLAKKEFENNYTVIYCKALLFGVIDKEWNLEDYSLEKLAIQNMIFCSAFFKKREWDRVGGYDENLRQGYEDWEFWISILKDGAKVYKIPQICFFYRKKEKSMLTELGGNEEKRVETLKYIYKKHIDFIIDYMAPYVMEMYSNAEELKKVYKSRRYKIGSFIVNIINKFKI